MHLRNRRDAMDVRIMMYIYVLYLYVGMCTVPVCRYVYVFGV